MNKFDFSNVKLHDNLIEMTWHLLLTSSDHGLTHLLNLLGRRHPGGGGVRIKDDLGTGIFPHLIVRHHGQDLHRVHVRLAVVLRDLPLRVPEGPLNGLDLRVSVHVQLVYVHFLPDSVANISLHLLNGGWLIPRL